MKRTTARAVAGLLIFGTITVGVRAYYANQGDDNPNIATALVTRGSLADEVSATGTLQPVTTVQVGSQLSGIVSWLGADFNSTVHKGQVIARLDPSLLESQVDQARASLAKATAEAENSRAQLAAARQTLERIASLHAKGVVAQIELEKAALAQGLAQAQVSSVDAQVVQARAALSQTEVNLARAVITSPIDGVVIQRNVDVGQAVSASVSSPTIFSVAAGLTAMEVNARIDESDIAKLRPLQDVTFQVDAYAGRLFSGTVRQVRLEPTLVQNVITYSAIIDAPNPDLALRPGMTANVKIEIARRDEVVRIPNAALRFKPSPDAYALLGQTPMAEKPRPKAGGDAGPRVELPVSNAAHRPSPSPAPVAATRPQSGATIDGLFSPLTSVETDGRVWIIENERLKPVQVRLGVTDGQNTELVAGDVQAGAALVTNVTAPGAAVRATATAIPAAGGIFMTSAGRSGAGGAGRSGGGGG